MLHHEPLSTLPEGTFTPVGYLTAATQLYAKTIGILAPRIDYRRVGLDPHLGQLISDAYMAAPSWEEQASAAYEAFREETIQQYGFLVDDVSVGSLGVAVEFVDDDPYPDALSMVDALARRRLKVYSTKASANPHPYLTDRENDMFRAVHDAFGHAASGRGFDRDGEEAAWLKHCFMYSPLARRAMTTETRGQNCAQSFHYRGSRFPEQKVALLAEHLCDPGAIRLGPQFAPSG